MAGAKTPIGGSVAACNGLFTPGSQNVFVQTRAVDGNVLLDIGTLMHEIGHAFDVLIAANRDGPRSKWADWADITKTEGVPGFGPKNTYYHDPYECFAELFSRFCLDEDRTAARFPKAVQLLREELKKAHLPFVGKDLLDGNRLRVVLRNMTQLPFSAIAKQIDEAVERREWFNEEQVRLKNPRQRYGFLLVSKDTEYAEFVAKHLSRVIFARRGSGSMYGFDDCASSVQWSDAAIVKDLENEIDRHALILFGGVSSPVNPAQLSGLLGVCNTVMDWDTVIPVVIVESENSASSIAAGFPKVLWTSLTLTSQTPQDTAALISRYAASTGYAVTPRALKAIEDAAAKEPLTLHKIEMLFAKFKQKFGTRVSASQEVDNIIRAADVSEALEEYRRTDPLEELNAMVGLHKVKDAVKTLMMQLRNPNLRKLVPRLNLLFIGNPGTGKTKVAQLLCRLFGDVGLTDPNKCEMLTAPDVIKKGSSGVPALWDRCQGGVILVDEFHQMNDRDTTMGKSAAQAGPGQETLKAMVPYLEDARYAKTVFIGAGYHPQVEKMIDSDDVDAGLSRRFPTNLRFIFDDYTKDELRDICSGALKGLGFAISPEALASLVATVMQNQRMQMNPGNAGTAKTTVEWAIQNWTQRQLNSPSGVPGPYELLMEDVETRMPPEPELADLPNDLRDRIVSWRKTVAANREKGLPLYESLPMRIIFQGSPGTGKSTTAEYIGKLFAAWGVLPSAETLVRAAKDLIAGYVGQTNLKIEALFKDAWGKTLFIDEVSGISNSIGGYGAEAVKAMLPYLEGDTPSIRGRFVVVIADYEQNIDDFLASEPGLPSRFPCRITIPDWDLAKTKSVIVKRLDEGKTPLTDEEAATMESAGLPGIVKHPAFANGRTAKRIADEIAIRKKSGDAGDVVADALAKVKHDLDSSPSGVQRRRDPNEGLAVQTATREAHAESVKPKADAHSEHMSTQQFQQYLEAIQKVNEAIPSEKKALYNRPDGIAVLREEEMDVNSELNAELAKALGVSPQEARKIRVLVRKKVKKLVERKRTVLLQHFTYHCPYCGGIESPSCGYINRPMEWKIEHSLRKPWTEPQEVTEIVEQEDEVVCEDDFLL